jgi:formate hydrogenlyase transcriptional activator
MGTLSSLDHVPPGAGCTTADAIVGRSPGLRDALFRLQRVAPTDITVLVSGETGTGKELMARAIHHRSRRAARRLVAVNAGAIPEALVASELFGHEHGAFTGAVQRRIGRFEMADHGTLFLDEVADLPAEAQIALLRVLQDGEFERLGASQTARVDVRVVAATNCDLEGAVDEGRFRSDLFYRLGVFPIHLPPLRERTEDIPPLASHFLGRVEQRLGRRFLGVEPASLQRLRAFSWPGNIRQLENVIQQSAVLCDDPYLSVPPELLTERSRGSGPTSRLDAALKASEQQLIERALEAAGGRVSGPGGAASRLGLRASTLESKIRRLRIDKLRYRMVRG